MLAVWGASQKAFKQLRPLNRWGSRTYLSSLPCSHRPVRDIHEVI